jgi:hypothetical protein
MFGGVALARSELSEELLERHGLRGRVHDRGGEPEVRFLARERERVLPVWLDGRLQIVRWGNRRGESRRLPYTAWTWRATVEAGGWAALEPEEVEIPAGMGLDRGVWYQIREGVKGLAVRDERGEPAVYVLVEPASHYYQVMTRSAWMPVLIGEYL